MKNELGRKITSLTIMTIMVAGGVTFAVPGFMPEAIADEKLMYVSVENPDFGNEFGGGQIVEIIVCVAFRGLRGLQMSDAWTPQKGPGASETSKWSKRR